jgi:hypothetical protein
MFACDLHSQLLKDRYLTDARIVLEERVRIEINPG